MACMSPNTVDRNWRVGVNPRLPVFLIGTSCTGPAHLPRFRHKSTKRSSLSVGSRFIGVLRCPVSLADVTWLRAAHLLAPTRNWHISNILRKAGTNPAIAWSNEVSWRPDCKGVRRRGVRYGSSFWVAQLRQADTDDLRARSARRTAVWLRRCGLPRPSLGCRRRLARSQRATLQSRRPYERSSPEAWGSVRVRRGRRRRIALPPALRAAISFRSSRVPGARPRNPAQDRKIFIAYRKRLLVRFEGLKRSATRWP